MKAREIVAVIYDDGKRVELRGSTWVSRAYRLQELVRRMVREQALSALGCDATSGADFLEVLEAVERDERNVKRKEALDRARTTHEADAERTARIIKEKAKDLRSSVAAHRLYGEVSRQTGYSRPTVTSVLGPRRKTKVRT